MAKPTAGSSLLFGALADSGRIKQRKNGNYRMVLKGVDEIDWFTDRPDRVAGEWSPKKLVKKWDALFGGVKPNAQATFEMGGKRELVTFEMFKPKLSDSNQTLSFKVRGISEKNKDLLTGLRNKQLYDVSLFIDDATNVGRVCSSNCQGEDLSNIPLSNSDLSNSDLSYAYLRNANLNLADLSSANLNNANLGDADLSYANLSNAKLTSANLDGAIISGAELNSAFLSGANLADANLNSTKLISANLDDANLTGAFLGKANLQSAILTNTNLSGANLTGAFLFGANLTGVNLADAYLADANLSFALLTDANLASAQWFNTTCPDGTKNSGTSPCTAEQLNLA